jgi:hypothetical protein
MWFLGAGASASAGIPTAYDMIWEFKRMLYCASRKVSIRTCSDLGDDQLRIRIQQYFDSTGGYPKLDSEDEYSFYFERVFPSERDRRRYIDQMVSEANLSFGHIALSALLKLDKIRLLWTTNFDRMVEDATAQMVGTSAKLVVSTLDTSRLAFQAINECLWPLLVKLHGDFQSNELKNTSDELKAQDIEMRNGLIEACKRFGLAVVGYSGRDNSIMDSLEAAIDGGRGYPFGLFWFQRSDGTVLPRVSDLIDRAAAVGIEAQVINVETFDELMSDLLLLVEELPAEVSEKIDIRASRVSDAPIPDTKGRWPVVRFNALPVLSYPTVCRRVVCDIGGVKAVQEAVSSTGADIIASRRDVGVIAFGSDSEVRKALSSFEIKEFDIHSIQASRLRWESAEHGMLYKAFTRALTRSYPVTVQRASGHYQVIIDPSRANDPAFSKLRKATLSITGTIPRVGLKWAEALWVRMEYRLGRLWFLIEPTIWFERSDDNNVFNEAREFVRKRLATRYNVQWNQIIDGWVYMFLGDDDQREVRAFGISDGVDAPFTLSGVTGFSRREVSR